MPKNTIPLYSAHANTRAERPLRYISENSATEMRRAVPQIATPIWSKKLLVGMQLLAPERGTTNSPASITFKECEANSGAGSQKAQARAQQKVAAWPQEYDRKNTTIVAGSGATFVRHMDAESLREAVFSL